MTFVLVLITILVIVAWLLNTAIFPLLEGLRGPKKSSYTNTKNYSKRENELFKIKGEQFEAFIAKKINQNRYLKILDWRSDKFIEGVYAESNKNPDLEIQFSFNSTCLKFSLECKYHSKIHTDIIIAPQHKIENYKKYSQEKKTDVFIVLGLAGEASSPNELYIIPLKYIKSEKIPYSDLQKFRKHRVESNFFFDEKLLMLK
jgi:hypothetical protein